ncbi:8768_t:CDS:1, partial [Paraglomus occultum]
IAAVFGGTFMKLNGDNPELIQKRNESFRESETTGGIRGLQEVDTPNKVMMERISVLSWDLFDGNVRM